MWLYVVIAGLIILLFCNFDSLFLRHDKPVKQDNAREAVVPWKAVPSERSSYLRLDGQAGLEMAQLNAVPLPPVATKPSEEERIVTEDRASHISTSVNVKSALVPEASGRLAASIQTELKRLGCYEGEVDNLWGNQTQRAIAKFNRMASADLKISEPTEKALTKVKKYAPAYCKSEPQKNDSRPRPQMLFSQTLPAAVPPVPSRDVQTESAVTQQERSYLPPWIKKQDMAAIGAGDSASKVASDVPPSMSQDTAKPVKRAAKKSRQYSSADSRRRRDSGRGGWSPGFFGLSWPFN